MVTTIFLLLKKPKSTVSFYNVCGEEKILKNSFPPWYRFKMRSILCQAPPWRELEESQQGGVSPHLALLCMVTRHPLHPQLCQGHCKERISHCNVFTRSKLQPWSEGLKWEANVILGRDRGIASGFAGTFPVLQHTFLVWPGSLTVP